MIEYLEQTIFIIIFSFFGFLIFRRSKTIYRNIFIGKKEYKSFNNKSLFIVIVQLKITATNMLTIFPS